MVKLHESLAQLIRRAPPRQQKPLYFAGKSGNGGRVKSLIRFTASLLFFGGLVVSAHAGFSSIYVFGDSVSATTTNYVTGTDTNLFYGKRYCNGRSWVEVLAQRQGLAATSTNTYNWSYSTNNLSFYGHYSFLMVSNVLKFTAPANASNCLFVVWVCNADFVGDLFDAAVGDPNSAPSGGTNLAAWTTAINQHLTNHFKAFTNLYAKGVRTLVAPNAVDVTQAPVFSGYATANKFFVRQRIINFNTNYATMLKQITNSRPDLTIYSPDIFKVFDGALTNAAAYGLTNALDNTGQPIAALDVASLSPWSLTGPGANYVFWESASPSARLNAVFADVAQQAISPVRIGAIVPVNTSNRLQLVNAPVGMNGTVLFATNLISAKWFTNSTFSTLTVTQQTFVNPTNAMRFYELKFPWQWTYP